MCREPWFQARLELVKFGVMYSHSHNFKLHGYSNSDWAGFVDDIRRTSGYCFSFAMEFFHGVLKNKKL